MDNTVSVAGNITRDPEVRYSPAGTALLRMSVAVNRRFTERATGVQRDETSFFDVEGFGQLAENVGESIRKGDRVTVTGRLRQQTWQDPATGENKYRVVIVADDVACSLRFATATVARNERRPAVSAVQDTAA